MYEVLPKLDAQFERNNEDILPRKPLCSTSVSKFAVHDNVIKELTNESDKHEASQTNEERLLSPDIPDKEELLLAEEQILAEK